MLSKLGRPRLQPRSASSQPPVKILLFGKNGQLGQALQQALAQLGSVQALGSDACDLRNASAIRAWIDRARPDWVVNAAAMTAVDRAERCADEAFAINAHAPGVMACEAARLGAGMVHYSTDYVFDGSLARPYVETDQPRPLNVYGASKWAGELAVAQGNARHWVFRTSWLLGKHGQNFARTMLQQAKKRETLQVVADQWGAPTDASWLASVTQAAIRLAHQRDHENDHGSADQSEQQPSPLFGTYHACSAGFTTWHAYAQYVLQLAHERGVALLARPETVQAVRSQDYPSAAQRPLRACLNTDKLRNTLGVTPPPWQTAVERVVRSQGLSLIRRL